MARGKATTLRDIAREVGVSTMTASMVLNGSRSSTRVSADTRARILEVSVRLRYRPNAVARGLSRQRMHNIGVVAEVQGEDVNLYFLEVLGGLIAAATDREQNTTVFSITNWEADQERVLQFCDGRVDGMVLLAPQDISQSVAEMLSERAQFVVIHSDCGPLHVDSVDCDDEGGAYAMVKYLISLGHRRIAHFAGPASREGANRRTSGYLRALAEAGIRDDDNLVTHGWYAAISGKERAQELLSRYAFDDLPTAIFCANDAIAAGCMEVLAANGLRVPEDISVTGFDGLLLSRMTTPALTTVMQPLRQMGHYAVERLLLRIDEALNQPDARDRDFDPEDTSRATAIVARTQAEPHAEIFPCELIVRGSSGPPRQVRVQLKA
jgi:LacI family transcriptional regulator